MINFILIYLIGCCAAYLELRILEFFVLNFCKGFKPLQPMAVIVGTLLSWICFLYCIYAIHKNTQIKD